MHRFAADEFPVSRAPKEEPGDWRCTDEHCSARGPDGGKGFLNFQRNDRCKVRTAPRPPQPCAYWTHTGFGRRHDQHGDCNYTHRTEDKGSRYGDALPDYVVGKGGGRDRSSSWAPSNRHRNAANQRQDVWAGLHDNDRDADEWATWQQEKVPRPPPVDDGAAREKELHGYLLAATDIHDMVNRINSKLPGAPGFSPVELHLAQIQHQHNMQIQQAAKWICLVFKDLKPERQNLATALGKMLIGNPTGSIAK